MQKIIDRYLANGRNYCPFCNSEQIFVQGMGALREAQEVDGHCLFCGRQWRERYKLAEIEEGQPDCDGHLIIN